MTAEYEALVEGAETEFLDAFVAGPQNIHWEELPPQVGDSAPDIELPTDDGKPVMLSEFWEGRPALVIFWRHFGCGCGLERAGRFRDEYEGYLEAGANVVIVGQGEPPRARAYKSDQGIGCPILCDLEREAYRAYGLLDFLPSQVLQGAPEPLLSLSRAAIEELANERRESGRPLVDSPWQRPGEFVIDSQGELRLTHRYQYCEDYPDPSMLRTAIRRARE